MRDQAYCHRAVARCLAHSFAAVAGREKAEEHAKAHARAERDR
jgi:hypothetical protein